MLLFYGSKIWKFKFKRAAMSKGISVKVGHDANPTQSGLVRATTTLT
jgi:hypothetical protein